MTDFILNQLEFARNQTLNLVDELTNDVANIVPKGFNNSILWNLGHIYVSQVRLIFHFAQEPAQLPEGYLELFGNGSKPSEWQVGPPSLDELKEVLGNQVDRIRHTFAHRLTEQVIKPYTTSAGLTLTTIGEFASFTFYHEGMHFSTIKLYKRLLHS